jgi:hypothetical protein
MLPMTTRQFNRAVHAAAEAGIKKPVTSHTLRTILPPARAVADAVSTDYVGALLDRRRERGAGNADSCSSRPS